MSNIPSASAGDTTSNSIGRVEPSESVSNAADFEMPNSVQRSHSGRKASVHFISMNVANASFSQMPFHHFMVTRSPNHMWAISWWITSATRSTSGWVARSRSTSSAVSRKVTQPRFSIAPKAKSGTATRSSLSAG